MTTNLNQEQKDILKRLYLIYGENIPYCYGGFKEYSQDLENLVYPDDRSSGFSQWWVKYFIDRGSYSNEYLTYDDNNYDIPAKVTDKFIEYIFN